MELPKTSTGKVQKYALREIAEGLNSEDQEGLILLALFLTVVISAVLLPVADALLLLFNWVDENRSISWLVFIIFYVMATVLVLPGSLLTLAAGFLFGLGYGFAIVSLASTLGATCAFLVGRFSCARLGRGQATEPAAIFGLGCCGG